MFWWHPNEAHNGYLEVFLNLGWVGIALLTSIIITGYRNLLSMLRWNPEACGLRMAFFVAALAYNFTEAGFRIMSPVWIFFLVAAVAVPKPRVAKAAEKGEAEKTNLWSEVPAPVPVGAHHLRHI
jgi:O-antigen ligase